MVIGETKKATTIVVTLSIKSGGVRLISFTLLYDVEAIKVSFVPAN